jgi:flagellar basal-body rod modification protein FlgD
MATAVLNHHATAAQALAGTTATSAATDGKAVKQTASTSSGTSTSSSDSDTISSSDFLTLLVTELKNQDPTANSDPNEYVNQLVAVNSLEQLININSTLTTDLGSSSSTESSDASTQKSVSSSATSIPSAVQTATSKLAPGNLSVPAANPAAQTVSQALSGRRNSQ